LRIVEHAPYEAIYRGVEGLWYARRFIDDRTLYNIAQFINQTQTGSLFASGLHQAHIHNIVVFAFPPSNCPSFHLQR